MNVNELLPDELIVIHQALERDGLPHAFGGAIALAFCGVPRFTQDIDINLAAKVGEHPRVLDVLSSLFPITDRERIENEISQGAQARLKWGVTPVDLFFSELPFHESLMVRIRDVDYAGVRIQVISAEDLIICKTAYNRGKDWADIENIFRVAGPDIALEYLRYWLDDFFPPEDERIRKIETYISIYATRSESDVSDS